jgi:aminoglycoside phosphotransferase (APT) family kinase protein
VIGHNDAAPYNAVWQTLSDGRTDLVGFIDWDFASPCAPIRDLAFVASAWVPLHNREAARAEGFDDFAARPRRLRMLLHAYGWTGTVAEVLDAVRARIVDHIRIVQELANGDPVFQRQVDAGAQADLQLTDIHETLRQFDRDRSGLDPEQAG